MLMPNHLKMPKKSQVFALLELGWRQMRASSTLHCHLGGTITSVGGASELIGGDENRRVILAVLGKSAPLAPAPGDTFAAGCT